jgi:hypothetical protein
MHVHPALPYADGVCFDDLQGFDVKAANHLAMSGTVYLTEFKANGHRYGGRIIARSQQQAEEIAFGRGLGEDVLGRLVLTGARVSGVFEPGQADIA